MDHGYYQVGNQAYVNKVEAILEAEATNQFPYFIFHDELHQILSVFAIIDSSNQ